MLKIIFQSQAFKESDELQILPLITRTSNLVVLGALIEDYEKKSLRVIHSNIEAQFVLVNIEVRDTSMPSLGKYPVKRIIFSIKYGYLYGYECYYLNK